MSKYSLKLLLKITQLSLHEIIILHFYSSQKWTFFKASLNLRSYLLSFQFLEGHFFIFCTLGLFSSSDIGDKKRVKVFSLPLQNFYPNTELQKSGFEILRTLWLIY